MLPIVFEPEFVNQRLPLGTPAMPVGTMTLGSVYVETVPVVVMRPRDPPWTFVNHKAPSGPDAIPWGSAIPGPV